MKVKIELHAKQLHDLEIDLYLGSNGATSNLRTFHEVRPVQLRNTQNNNYADYTDEQSTTAYLQSGHNVTCDHEK